MKQESLKRSFFTCKLYAKHVKLEPNNNKIKCWLSLSSISMNIIFNARRRRFKCAEIHYLFIYRLKKSYE